MTTRRELCAAEDAGWLEICALLDSLDPAQLEQVGYSEGWSAKDLMAHLGGWMAETVQVLEQLREGTFEPFPYDVEELNGRFVEANRDQPAPVVKAEMISARTRMVQEYGLQVEPSAVAQEWFTESGPAHYEEHLPRLRQWVEELR